MNDEIENELPIYMQASADDYKLIAIDSILDASEDADFYEIENLFSESANTFHSLADNDRYRACSALSAVCSFHFTPYNMNEPFEPKFIMNGKRGAIPNDFIGEPVRALETIVDDIQNIPLRTRINDLIWLTKRSNYQNGVNAALGYLEIVRAIKKGELKLRHNQNGFFGLRAIELICRSLSICRGLNYPSDLKQDIAKLLNEMICAAIAKNVPLSVKQLCELSLSHDVLDDTAVVNHLETSLKWEEDLSYKSNYWTLVASAYHKLNDDDSKWKCLTNAAECYVEHANKFDNSMLKANWLATGLSAYHGIPKKKPRRLELRHQLIDVQGSVSEEMTSFESSSDITDLVHNTKNEIEELKLGQKLGYLASIRASPDPNQLKKNARELIQKYPLSSLFGRSTLDSEGKVVNKFASTGFHSWSDEAIEAKIFQKLQIYRSLVVSGSINPVLRSIAFNGYLPENYIDRICVNSPFVPIDRQLAYKIGLHSFFRGDQLAALNILVPQLENSVRHILRNHGFDPTSFSSTTHVQEDRPLTSIFGDMKDELHSCFGEVITYEIGMLFLKKGGPNLRNLVAHGLLADHIMEGSDVVYANWFIYRMCCILLLKSWDTIFPE